MTVIVKKKANCIIEQLLIIKVDCYSKKKANCIIEKFLTIEVLDMTLIFTTEYQTDLG